MSEFSYIILGSNMGDSCAIIAKAVEKIGERCGKIVASSSVYESEPWGFDAENNFLNQMLCIETDLDARTLLKELLQIEAELGRQRHESQQRYVSRPIDIDIVYYSDMINDDDFLVLPHPRMSQRKFVLMPLCEIAADFIHPVFKKSSMTLLKDCNDDSEVSLYEMK